MVRGDATAGTRCSPRELLRSSDGPNRRAAVGRPVGDLGHPGLPRTVSAAEVLPARLHAMTDNRHLAVNAARREDLDRALERVEHVAGAADRDLERLVVGV